MEEYGEAKYLSIIIFAVDTAFLDVNLSEQEKQTVCQSLSLSSNNSSSYYL